MSRLTSQSWQMLVCVFEQLGFKFVEQRGSHMKYERPGVARPLMIPRYSDHLETVEARIQALKKGSSKR